ncbi:hypothetical protein PGT21_003499 [Puccinia graminis f. sp. tritici]|uniref:Uncharacterized protein n=1 Tax=Puccinia graminis f. sp. tritici TaxID=56615 RepID=A0A5B0MB83_PUCGR|nr:hypothetical protein PGT21_003499 [Puccinia graminis f. sp. tritici]
MALSHLSAEVSLSQSKTGHNSHLSKSGRILHQDECQFHDKDPCLKDCVVPQAILSGNNVAKFHEKHTDEIQETPAIKFNVSDAKESTSRAKNTKMEKGRVLDEFCTVEIAELKLDKGATKIGKEDVLLLPTDRDASAGKERLCSASPIGCDRSSTLNRNQLLKKCSSKGPYQGKLEDVVNSATAKLEFHFEFGNSEKSSKTDYDPGKSITNNIELLSTSHRKATIEMQKKHAERIRMAIQPFPSTNPGEIFPGVIKGMWSDVVHTSQPLLQKIFEYLQKRATSERGISKAKKSLSLRENCSQLAFQIFETQLQLSKNQNHLPLGQLSNENYIAIKFLWNLHPDLVVAELERCAVVNTAIDQYELHRRIITFTTQIAQKTIVENWGLIKKSLIERKELTPTFLKKFESFFQLKAEFPDVFVWSEMYFSGKEPDCKKLRKIGQSALSLYVSMIGYVEYHRRQRGHKDYLETKPPKWELSESVFRDLKEAERSNGVNVWNISHLIHWLGLGQNKRFELCGKDEILNHLMILDTLISSWYIDDITWYESPDRAWLRRTFKEEYDQKLNSLCDTASNIFRDEELLNHIQTLKLQAKENFDYGIISKLINENVAYRLTVKINGLDEQMMVLIKFFQDRNTGSKDGHTNWEAVWDSFPSEVKITLEQREFAQSWLSQLS